MDNEYTPDIVTLIDEEGNEHGFEILDQIEIDGSVYYALYPLFDNPEDSVNDSGEYYIMESVTGDDGEEEMSELDDEVLLDNLAELFEKRFAEMFEYDEENE